MSYYLLSPEAGRRRPLVRLQIDIGESYYLSEQRGVQLWGTVVLIGGTNISYIPPNFKYGSDLPIY